MRQTTVLAGTLILSASLAVQHTLAATSLPKVTLQDCLRRPMSWFNSPEAAAYGSNVLTWQSRHGGWPKNTDTLTTPWTGTNANADLKPTFDNGATVGQMRFLARLLSATNTPVYRASFDKGLAYMLHAQYENGGWPQSYPFRPDAYERHITFNDGAMVGVMQFLREISPTNTCQFVTAQQKNLADGAFRKGVECILKCQIRVGEELTAWCAQHDAQNFKPASARSYELVSLSGAESAGIVRLLMSLQQPTPEVVRSVQGAIRWFQAAALRGIKVQIASDPASPKGTDKRVVKDSSAPPMWARFYEIGTNLPIFCGRDGVPKHHLNEIESERRNGYSWLGYWPAPILESGQ